MTTRSRNTVRGPGDGGAWILDDYEPLEAIGRGAFATAYLCRIRGGQKRAVVKVTHPDLIRGRRAETFRRRYSAEVRSMVAVDHPNLVRIHRGGITPSGLPAIAMDYVEGPTLEQVLSTGPVMRSMDVLGLLRQLASALRCVHERDIVHRDVSPQNIILEPTVVGAPRPVLLDFGVAAFTTERDSQTVVGTPRYIAPERLTSAATDLSDMYSLGAIGWWAYTGLEHELGASVGDVPRRRWDLLSRVVVEPMLRALVDLDPRRRMTAREVERQATVALDGPVEFRPVTAPRVAVVDGNAVTATVVQSVCRAGGADPVQFITLESFFRRRCRRMFDLVVLVGDAPQNPVVRCALGTGLVRVVFGAPEPDPGAGVHTLRFPDQQSVLIEELEAQKRTPSCWTRTLDAWMDAWRCVLDSPSPRCNHCAAKTRELSDLEHVAGSKEPPRLSRLLRALFDQGDHRAAPGLLDELQRACESAVRHRVKENGPR